MVHLVVSAGVFSDGSHSRMICVVFAVKTGIHLGE
jgi:hypothetical protein